MGADAVTTAKAATEAVARAEAEVAAAELQKERVAMGVGEGMKIAADEETAGQFEP